jgi:hypothetical protein
MSFAPLTIQNPESQKCEQKAICGLLFQATVLACSILNSQLISPRRQESPSFPISEDQYGYPLVPNYIMSTSPYKPLDLNLPNVRLLVLEAGMWDSTIKCELRLASLDKGPCYKAPSYV